MIKNLFYILISLFLISCQGNIPKKISLHGLNDITKKDLKNLKKELQNIGYDTIFINENIFYKENTEVISVYELFEYIREFNTPNHINIYLTNSKIECDGDNVDGVSRKIDNSIIIYNVSPDINKTLVLHEIVHLYNIDHCENDCIMDHGKKTYDAWDKKTNRPIFCDVCKEIVPKFLQ